MRFVLSIILIVTLLVMIFYGFDFKEDFEETIISYKCCGKGIRGQRGVIGPNGNQQGIQGITGAEGDQGIKGDKGNKGDKGLQGESGLRGIKGMQGEQGVTGSIGPVGKSAYDAAYDAAILENPSPEWANDTYDKDKRIDMWRDSLKGDQGITGNVSGVTGLVGFSAYNIAYNLEEKKSNDNRSDWFNSGDKDEWLTSLTGEVGIMGGEGGEDPLNIPIGIIVAFHTPSIKDPIPEGWAECNGQNGTPDLRGRFILGGTLGDSGSVNAVGDVGGVEKHTLTDDEQNTPHTHPNTVKLRLSCQDNGGQLNAINDQGNPHLNTTAKNTTALNTNADKTGPINRKLSTSRRDLVESIEECTIWRAGKPNPDPRSHGKWNGQKMGRCNKTCAKWKTEKKFENLICPKCYGNNCPRCSGDNCPPCIPGAPVANGGCPGRDCSGIDIATSPKKYNTMPRSSAATVAHENMPPFYVLRYIMKV
jgi:microcystin-dependent protein